MSEPVDFQNGLKCILGQGARERGQIWLYTKYGSIPKINKNQRMVLQLYILMQHHGFLLSSGF